MFIMELYIIVGLFFIAVGLYDDEQSYCPITWTFFVQKYLLGLPRKTFISGMWDFEYDKSSKIWWDVILSSRSLKKSHNDPPTPPPNF